MKQGFTVIEILIVLAIIGVLSSLAVSGYLSYRRNALIDLSVDNFVSQVEEIRGWSIYGEVGGAKYEEILARLENGEDIESQEIDVFCYGFYFENNRPRFFSLIVNFLLFMRTIK